MNYNEIKMVAPDKNPKLEDLRYPVYVQPLIDLPEITYSEADLYLLCYFDYKKNKRHVFDVISKKDLENKKNTTPFSERIKIARETLSSIANYEYIIDLATDIITNPAELLELYKKYLTNGYKGVRILDENGVYRFGEIVDGEYWELKPRKNQ